MSSLDFTKLRSGNAECPSDLKLDRLAAGELDAAARSPIEAHVSGCEACTARMTERTAGWNAQPVDPRKLLAAIRRAEPVPVPWTRRFAPLLGLIALGAGALALMLKPEPQYETRFKGGLTLRVFRLENGHAREVESGSQFAAGDRLRFVVDLPSAGAVEVLGVERDGNLYKAWPQGSDDVQRAAGSGVELPGAVALDATPGDETFFLVHCPGQTVAPTCTSAGAGVAPRCGSGCNLTSFQVKKP
jgi:hypothetical protein